jgi:hypothetical protein
MNPFFRKATEKESGKELEVEIHFSAEMDVVCRRAGFGCDIGLT